MVIAPWNYPYPHRRQLDRAGADGRQCGDPQACERRRCWSASVSPRLSKAAGLPDGLFQNLVLNHADTEKLIGSGKIDHVNFTGSVEGGRRIERAAAGTFATLGLELGGKDPAYVRADAKLDYAVENLVDGAFFNSGQCCCGVERIYVHEDVYDEFVEGFVDETQGLDARQSARAGHRRRADGAAAVRRPRARADGRGAAQGRHGASQDAGTSGDKAGSPYLAPEVLTDVNHQMAVMREESFGPGRRHHEGARRRRGDHADERQPLWADRLDLDRRSRRARRGSARGSRPARCYANRCDYLDPALVWTGVKDTGKGGALSEIGYAQPDAAEMLSTSRSHLIVEDEHMATQIQLELPHRRPLRRRPHRRAARCAEGRRHQEAAARHRCRARQSAGDAERR